MRLSDLLPLLGIAASLGMMLYTYGVILGLVQH